MRLFNKKIHSKEITLFTRKLATLVSSGIPLASGIHFISKGYEKGPLYFLTQKLKQELERGQMFSKALQKYPSYFNSFYCGLIEIGELSGNLDLMLKRLAETQEKSDLLKRKLKNALTYPVLILCVAMTISMFLLIKVVPTFKEMFQNFKMELPLGTQILLKTSEIITAHGFWVLFLGSSLGFIFFHFSRQNIKVKNFIQTHVLRFPLFGSLIYKSHIANITRILATTEAAGVPLRQSLETLISITNNIIFVKALRHIHLLLGRGSRLEIAMESTHIFPCLVTQMVSIGEESGTLDQMLEKVSSMLDEELEAELEQLSALVEPLMMIVLGLLIGGLVIALYLPIFKMGTLF